MQQTSTSVNGSAQAGQPVGKSSPSERVRTATEMLEALAADLSFAIQAVQFEESRQAEKRESQATEE